MSTNELKAAEGFFLDFFEIGDNAATMACITSIMDLREENVKKREEDKMSTKELKTAEGFLLDFFKIGDDAATMACITTLMDLRDQNVKKRKEDIIRNDQGTEKK